MYHAFAAAMGALAIYSLLGRLTASRPLRALGAAVAIQPNALYAYALEGGIKELTTATPADDRWWQSWPSACPVKGGVCRCCPRPSPSPARSPRSATA